MIVIADIHLGKVNDSIIVDGEPSQTADIRKRLDSILARARMTKQCIVVAGDIFNKMNPTTQILSVFFSWLSLCSKHEVEVYLIAGNHDAGVDWTSTMMMANADLPSVTVVTAPTMCLISELDSKVEVILWPHIPAYLQEQAEQGHGSVSKWVATRYPDAKFIITHGMLDIDYYNDIFFEAGNAMRIDPTMFKDLKLMVLGHIHNHSAGVVSGGAGRWVYPGSLTINNFGEVDEEKGWVEVDIKTLDYVWHQFPDNVTPWVHVELDLTDKDETSLSDEAIKSIASGAIVKITVLAKAHGVVNEALIRQMFNAHGYVSRFETVLSGDYEKVLVSDVTVSHEALLEEHLNGVDAKKSEKARALSIGKTIIAEVLS